MSRAMPQPTLGNRRSEPPRVRRRPPDPSFLARTNGRVAHQPPLHCAGGRSRSFTPGAMCGRATWPNARYACPRNHAPIAVLLRPACAESAEPLHSTRTGASRRAPSHFGTRIKLRHPSQIGTWNRHIQRPTASAPWFGTILALVSNHPRRVRLPPVWCKKTWETTRKSLPGKKTPEGSGLLFVWCSVRWPVG